MKKPAPKTEVAAKSAFHPTGTWMTKVTRSEISICECGAKYIKTRPKQKACIPCMRLALINTKR